MSHFDEDDIDAIGVFLQMLMLHLLQGHLCCMILLLTNWQGCNWGGHNTTSSAMQTMVRVFGAFIFCSIYYYVFTQLPFLA